MPNANWSNPTLTSTYTNFVAEVKNRDEDLALQFDGTTSSNIPTGAIRWTSSANTWQKWTGSAWGALSTTFAFPEITVTGSSLAKYFGMNATGTAGGVSNGMYAPAGNQLGLVTGTNERLRINSSGDVGIGTASPGYRLDVQGGNARIYAGGGGTSLEIGNGATGNQFAFIDLVGDTTYSDYGLRLIRDNAGANSNSILRHRGTGYLSIATEDAASVIVATTNVERMRVTSDGKVGIGTSTPAASFDVQSPATTATTGNVRIAPSTAGQARYHLFNGGATAEWLFGQKTSADHSFKLSKLVSTSESDYLTVTDTGNVGIGTTTPGGLFELSTGASVTLNGEILLQRIRSNTTNSTFLDIKSRRHTAGSDWTGVGFRLQHQVDSTAMGFIEFNSLSSGQDVAIGTAGSTRLLIGSSGQLGLSGANYGTAGQVLTSAGASAPPTWVNPVPAGAVNYFAMSSAPTGYLKANGAAISRSTYSVLFAAIGTTFGVGDGSTTFNVPDLRGEFPRGWDDSRGVDSGRGFGSAQGQDLQPHTHTMRNTASDNLNAGSFVKSISYITTSGTASDTGSAGGTETRPRNVALLACIKF